MNLIHFRNFSFAAQWRCWSTLFLSVLCCVFAAHSAFGREVIPREQSLVGVIAGVNGDAEIRLVDGQLWNSAVVKQGLASGDGLRTGSFGTMALLFSDHTQIQMQRRSLLTVKAVATASGDGSSVFGLQRGGVWSRAARGGTGVRIETPSATAAIRGTDWSLTVDGKGRSQLIVLEGEVQFENEQGSVLVHRGEIAFAEIGQAPTKTVLTHPSDQTEQIYNFSLAANMRSIRLTQGRMADLSHARLVIEASNETERSGEQWLDLAELAYDMNDRATVQRALDAVPAEDVSLLARRQLILGFQALASHDFVVAEDLLAKANTGLDPERKLSAGLGRVGALLLERRSAEAEALLGKLANMYGDVPCYLSFRALLTAFSGDMATALEKVKQDGRRFPDVARFAAMEAVFSLALDQPDHLQTSARRALGLDPGSVIARQALSLYLQNYMGDSEGAIAVLKEGLDLNRWDDSLWGGLALIYYQIGELRMSEEAYLGAIALNPKSVSNLRNYGLLLLAQYRLDEAQELLQRADDIDPGRDFVLSLQGRLAMQRGQLDLAQDVLLKATTISPGMSDAAMLLAQNYYQSGKLALTRQTIDNADRLDPNEPLIPLVASVIASDQAYADEAIEYARKAIERYRHLGGTGVTGLAASRGGSTNLGASFGNLGLANWADNYSELSYDPYMAESHMFRASQEKDTLSSLFQGLLLDPLAAASRNRFVDFYRRPFYDVELGGSVDFPQQGTGYGASANIQGFLLSPKPTSYWLAIEQSDTPKDRENNDRRQTAFNAVIGTELSPYDRLLIDIEGGTAYDGLPGNSFNPDFDDDSDGKFLSGGIGYSHTFSAKNIVMARVMAKSMESEFSNDDALGTTEISTLDYSLVRNFGVEDSRLLYDLGVSNTGNSGAPSLQVGGGAGTLTSTIPNGLDENPIVRNWVQQEDITLSLRHMITVSSFDLSYGAELMPYRLKTETDSLNPGGNTVGVGQVLGLGESVAFLYGEPVLAREHSVQNGLAANGHVNSVWRMGQNVRLETGLFLESLDDGLDESDTRLNPRIGLAWEVAEGDWIRLVLRDEMNLGLSYTLAPVATVGLVADTAFIGYGGRSRLYAARWDREWNKRLFSTFELRRQEIEGFSRSIADSRNSLDLESGLIDQAEFTVNLWLQGGIGLFGTAILSDTEDRSSGIISDRGLPLVPEQYYRGGVTWIHPAQIRLTLSSAYVGERLAGVVGEDMLEAYQTVDFAASWQPLSRHLELNLAVINLLDEEYEAAFAMPGRGRLISATAKWRF